MGAAAGPLQLAAAVRAVALLLEGQPVRVVGLDAYNSYVFELRSDVIAVVVHVRSPNDVDLCGDLFEVAVEHDPGRGLYARSGSWLPGVRVKFYGPAQPRPAFAGVGS